MSDPTPTLHLKKGSAKPLHSGHPWVFAAAIACNEGSAQAGDEVRVVDDRGSCIGRGFYSPDSAIAVRIITRADTPVTDSLLCSRMDEALRLRREVLRLGVPASEPAQAGRLHHNAEEIHDPKDRARLAELDAQLAKIQSFAAQYGMDPLEETAELRKRRDELLKSALRAPLSELLALPGKVEHHAMHGIAETTAYRLINSEGDGLGGLTVDVYGDYLAVQIGTPGMERRQKVILDALEERLRPKGILDRGDARTRQIEKLDPPKSGPLRGSAPDSPFPVYEYGVAMLCDLRSGRGQKTGLYLDQRENRKRFAELAAGRNVLDVFSYSGGFSVHAARAGAKSITLIESSEEALEMARSNLEHNKIDDADLVHAEWPEGFKHLREAGRLYDLIALDPPKFARGKENVSQALAGYRDLNLQAARLLAPGGLLFTCSCSAAVSELEFERTVAGALCASGRRAVLLERRGAAPDHPAPPGFDQGRYLKCLVLQVV